MLKIPGFARFFLPVHRTSTLDLEHTEGFSCF